MHHPKYDYFFFSSSIKIGQLRAIPGHGYGVFEWALGGII
jgi:hypothetical protein